MVCNAEGKKLKMLLRKMKKNEVKLVELKKKKASILNEVMEKETYKVAKEILEKYAPEQLVSKNSVSIHFVFTTVFIFALGMKL